MLNQKREHGGKSDGDCSLGKTRVLRDRGDESASESGLHLFGSDRCLLAVSPGPERVRSYRWPCRLASTSPRPPACSSAAWMNPPAILALSPPPITQSAIYSRLSKTPIFIFPSETIRTDSPLRHNDAYATRYREWVKIER